MVSRIIPKGAWHVRIHEIQTEHDIDVADGGFAIPVESGAYDQIHIEVGGGLAGASFPWGISRVISLSGGTGRVVNAYPNTNLLNPLTLIPTICHRLKPGRHHIITCVMGDCSKDAANIAAQVPIME